MLKYIAILALISLLSNPVYNIDGANIQYKMTVSATGFPLSLSYNIGVDISISQSGAIDINLDLGNIPANWSDEIPDEISSLFILKTSEIADKSVIIGETDVDLQEKTEYGLMSLYYGANVLYFVGEEDDIYGSAKWNKATGILLSLHIEIEPSSDLTVNVDIEYQSSNINIYADQNPMIQIANQAAVFFATPIGIITIVVAAVIATILIVAYFVIKKQKEVAMRGKEMSRRKTRPYYKGF